MKSPRLVHRIKHYLELFSAIPKERWCTGNFTQPGERFCALGHLGMTTLSLPNSEALEFSELITDVIAPGRKSDPSYVTRLNDGRHSQDLLFGSEPKNRICNVLRKRLEMETQQTETL